MLSSSSILSLWLHVMHSVEWGSAMYHNSPVAFGCLPYTYIMTQLTALKCCHNNNVYSAVTIHAVPGKPYASFFPITFQMLYDVNKIWQKCSLVNYPQDIMQSAHHTSFVYLSSVASWNLHYPWNTAKIFGLASYRLLSLVDCIHCSYRKWRDLFTTSHFVHGEN